MTAEATARGGSSRIRSIPPSIVAVCLCVATVLLATIVPLWRLRAAAARVFDRVPNAVLPTPFVVLPPPDAEYAGVWDVPPAVARQRLIDDYGFSQQLRAYLHAYERGGRTRYEAASCAYRPEGFTGEWQLHVRLFPTGTGGTDVWCHWERNPNVAPIAHLRQDGYDPAEGIDRFRELVCDPVRPPETDAPEPTEGDRPATTPADDDGWSASPSS